MNDKDKFIATTVAATALFISPWALICSYAAYRTWKFLDNQKARDDAEMAQTEVEDDFGFTNQTTETPPEAEMTAEKEEPIIDLTDIVKEQDPFHPDNQVYCEEPA